MAPEFKPGCFEPVLTVSMRGDGNTRAFHGDNEGLFAGCLDVFKTAFATSAAGGSNTEFTRAGMTSISKVFAHYLWVRQLSNQLNELGFNDRYRKEVATDLILPEPIVKLFNCFGHVEHEEVKYTQLDLEREYAWAIVKMAWAVRDLDWNDDNPTVHDTTQSGWMTRLNLNSTGEIQVDYHEPVRAYVLRLITHINAQNIDHEYKLRLIKNIIDVATERDLTAILRWLRVQPNVGNLPPRARSDRSNDFENFLRETFGNDTPNFLDGRLGPRIINPIIRKVVEGMRNVVDELFIGMAVVPIPRYEKGSLAQLSETNDDLTFSQFPLSLADLTVSAAFKIGRNLRRFLRASPELVASPLRAELIRKSIRRRA
nr:MAG: coat protein [Aspergillus flavus partitivirus 1]BED98285.1 MAG: coat protein [Aspergillus flavus partitivirus 1]BED98324.1 MAG: coat protein [Aspergillus flavus partitivirus 1]